MNLIGLVLWVPVLPDDNAVAAAQQAGVAQDERMTHLWDGNALVGRHLRALLGLQGPAWDLYLVYRPGVSWGTVRPPVPDTWMHQISRDAGADPRRRLDSNVLGCALDRWLECCEPQLRSDESPRPSL